MRTPYNSPTPGDWLEDLYNDQAIEERAAFRCDRCGGRFPRPLKVVQDGMSFCRVRCADPWSAEDLARDKARAASLAAMRTITPLGEDAHLSATADDTLVGITELTPRPLRLTAGGATGEFTLTGVGLSSDDDVTFSAGSGLTATGSYDADGLGGTLTVDPAAAVAGDWDMTYAGATYRGVVRVR